MKTKKRSQLLIVLLILLITLAIGYAVFSDQVVIGGTATMAGNIEIVFKSGTVHGNGYGDAIVSTDGKTLNVDVELTYPGDGTMVTAIIENKGTVPVSLSQFTLSGVSPELIVTFPLANGGSNSDVILSGGTCEVIFAVEWDPADDSDNNSPSKTGSFTATFDYIQDLTGFVPNTSYTVYN